MLIAVAASLLLAAPAGSSAWTLDGAAQVQTGALSGLGIRDTPAAVLVPRAWVKTGLRLGAVELELPAELRHRQSFGARLSESDGRLGLSAQWRAARALRLEAFAALRFVYRPGWADLYQPRADGSYAPTDRYSHFDRKVSLRAAWRVARGHHARLKLRVGDLSSLQDPAFDPISAPMHLTPRNRLWREAEAGWRFLGSGYKVGAALTAFQRDSLYLFSRDAGTGLTHAGPGGPAPNPLLSVRGIEPSVEGEVSPGSTLELSARLGVESVTDLFQGYYSYTGLHPEAAATVSLGEVVMVLSASARLRRYGERSYAEGPRHPPLTFGTWREDRLFGGRLRLRWPLAAQLTFIAEARCDARSTNFPPYVPSRFPRGRSYDIDWSYTRFQLLVGLRWSMSDKSGKLLTLQVPSRPAADRKPSTPHPL